MVYCQNFIVSTLNIGFKTKATSYDMAHIYREFYELIILVEMTGIEPVSRTSARKIFYKLRKTSKFTSGIQLFKNAGS